MVVYNVDFVSEDDIIEVIDNVGFDVIIVLSIFVFFEVNGDVVVLNIVG